MLCFALNLGGNLLGLVLCFLHHNAKAHLETVDAASWMRNVFCTCTSSLQWRQDLQPNAAPRRLEMTSGPPLALVSVRIFALGIATEDTRDGERTRTCTSTRCQESRPGPPWLKIQVLDCTGTSYSVAGTPCNALRSVSACQHTLTALKRTISCLSLVWSRMGEAPGASGALRSPMILPICCETARCVEDQYC